MLPQAFVLNVHAGQAPGPAPGSPAVPHKCTARSAAAIAAQIDPAWKYSHSLPPGHGYRCVSTTREYDVVTGQGPKRIPAEFCADMLLLRCPYTHETFVFKGGPRPYIERPQIVEPPSHVGQTHTGQSGLCFGITGLFVVGLIGFGIGMMGGWFLANIVQFGTAMAPLAIKAAPLAVL